MIVTKLKFLEPASKVFCCLYYSLKSVSDAVWQATTVRPAVTPNKTQHWASLEGFLAVWRWLSNIHDFMFLLEVEALIGQKVRRLYLWMK